MAFDKITQADLTGKGVIGLPDTPQLPTMQMQQKLDEIALDVIVPKFNAVVDKLNDPAGADDTQVTDPTTGEQGSLNDALRNIEDENAMNTLNRHNHENLGTLDEITAETKAAYDRLVALLGAITAIQNVLSGATYEIPTGKATSDAIQTVQDEVDLNTLARHTHDNKATLDDITAQVKQGYDRIVTLLTGITGVETTLTNSNDKIARSDAVYTAIDNLAQIVALNTAARHTHANKATLDAIDALTKQAYDALVTTFSGKTVEQTVTNDADKLPSGAAVVAYVSSLGGGDMLKSRYDTNDDGTVDSADYATDAGHATTADSATTATSADSATTAGYANSAGDSTRLGGLLSSAYAPTADVQKLFGDIATYQGTSAVALRTYAIGDFMIYNNYFYEVIQGIPQGGSIVVNTNITQKTVGEVLARLGKVMTGATSLLNGTAGLVPAPQAGDEDKYLKGDGTWGAVASTPTAAKVSYDNTQSGMTADDVQEAIDELNADFIGSTSEDDGTHGLVPAPLAGDEGKYLKGDGTWATPSNGGTSSGSIVTLTDNTEYTATTHGYLELAISASSEGFGFVGAFKPIDILNNSGTSETVSLYVPAGCTIKYQRHSGTVAGFFLPLV